MPVLSNIKLEFKEYPSGSWTDWSEYLINSPVVSKKIESDNPGEPGAVVFDSVKLFLRYETGNPVYQKFSIDLSSIQRYLFKISFLDNSLNYVVKFIGQADFSTIEWNDYNNIINFTVVDKLASITLIPSIPAREQRLLWDRVLSQINGATFIDFHYNTNVGDRIWIMAGFPDIYDDLTDLVVYPGEVLDIPEITTGLSRLRVVKQSWLEINPEHGCIANRVVFSPPLEGSIYDIIRYNIEDRPTFDPVVYTSNIYGQDCNIYEGDTLKAYDGLKIIKGIYQTVWPTDNFNIIPEGLVFNLPVEYSTMFLNERPMNKTMLDALITLINSLKPSTEALSGAYIITDETSATVIAKNNISDAGQLTSIGSTKILSFRKRHFWDKLADGAKVVLKSWVIDKASGKLKDYVGEAVKGTSGYPGKIKPRNEVKKDIIATQDYHDNVDEFYSNLANAEASSLLDFYGKRREKLSIGLNLDDNTINWDLIDRLNYDGKIYFFTNLSISEKSITVEAIEIEGHDYDIRQVLISPSTQSFNSDSGTIQVIQGNTSSGYYFTSPLELLNNTVSLKYSNNLKITDNKLNTIQDIATTSTPTFVQLILSNAGTTISNAVRADRSINTSYPLTGGGNLTADRTLGLSYNTANLKLTSNALDTIQNISVTSTPTFAQLILSNAGTTTSNAVRGDRNIATSYPLTGGGNLTADRTIGLSYDSTNLRITSNALNTIQDIATTSSPTFLNLTINNNATVRKWISGNNSSTLFDKDSRLTAINIYPNGFLEYYLNFRFEQDALRFANKRPDLFTITYSNDFTASEIDKLFSNYQQSINLQGKSENCWIQVDAVNPSAGILGDIPTLAYVLFHANNSPVSVKIEIQSVNDPVWRTVFDGNGFTALGNWTQNSQINGYISKIRWTFYNISISTPTFIRWIGHLVQRGPGYRHTVSRYGDTMHGDLLFYRGTKSSIGTGDNNDFGLVTNSTERITIKNSGDVGIGTTAPAYKLDVNGTGRFSQDLTLSSLLKQQGTTGTNDFSADIKQLGNKSIYNNFTSGWTGSGWRVDYGITATNRSHLELDDLTVRGTMRVYELIINQIRATNGSLFVSSSAKAESVVRVAGDPVTYTITFEDPEGHNVCPFLVDDIIIVQRVRLDSTTIVKQIVCQVTNVTGKTVNASVIYENGQIAKGDLAVRIGNTSNTNRQGSVYLTSDDSNAPYIDIVDGVNSWSAWSSSNKLKVRMGRLTGITDSFFGTLSGYGLYAKSNAYLRGKIYAEAGGWLAGWSINSTSLTSPLISSTHQISLIADNANSIIGTYADINLGGANPLYISFGRIKINSTTYSSSNYGLSAKDETGNDYFELSNNIKHIAGWNFDSQKLYKDTSIELNSNSNSVGVNSNKVKIFYSDSNNWGINGRDTSNNLVFQLGSTNKIAGWTFNNEHIYKLTSGTPTSSPVYGLTISGTSAASVVIAYGSNYQRYVKFGYQTSGNWFGIEGTDSNANIIFQLGSTNKISGWNFDTAKLSNGVVSLEASASMKGLVVDTDWVRVGDFTTSTLSLPYTNVSQTHFNYSNPTIQSADSSSWSLYQTTIHRRDDAAGSIVKIVTNNSIYMKAVNEENVEADDLDEVTYRVIHNLYNATSYLTNRKVKLHFKLKAYKWINATNWHNLNCNVYLIYFDSGWSIIKTHLIFSQTILESNVTYGMPYVIDKTGSNAIEFYLPGNVSNVSDIYLTFSGGFLVGGQYRKALNFEITDVDIETRLGCKVQMNKDGIEVYNSDENYLRFRNNLLEINSANIKSNGKQITRYLGKLSTAPGASDNVFEGDIYVKSSDNTVWICYGFTGEVPLWKQIS